MKLDKNVEFCFREKKKKKLITNGTQHARLCVHPTTVRCFGLTTKSW